MKLTTMLLIIGATLALVSTADARDHQRVHCNDRGCTSSAERSTSIKVHHHGPGYQRHRAAPVKYARRHYRQASQVVLGPITSGYSDRPRACYGIQWCGCWLRHQFGFSDTGLNLAWNWTKVGSAADIHSGNVIVWPHHVGKYNGVRQGHRGTEVLLTSGNDGGAVRTRWFPVNGLGRSVFRRV